MKLKAAFLALAVAGLAAALAFAAPGRSDEGTTTGSTTTTSTTPGWHHCHAVEVAGTVAAVSSTSLTVNVQRANHEGAQYAGKTATFAVGPRTRVLWQGAGTFTGPNQGDRVAVAASCDAAASTMTAARVVAGSPRPDHGGQGGDSQQGKRN